MNNERWSNNEWHALTHDPPGVLQGSDDALLLWRPLAGLSVLLGQLPVIRTPWMAFSVVSTVDPTSSTVKPKPSCDSLAYMDMIRRLRRPPAASRCGLLLLPSTPSHRFEKVLMFARPSSATPLSAILSGIGTARNFAGDGNMLSRGCCGLEVVGGRHSKRAPQLPFSNTERV